MSQATISDPLLSVRQLATREGLREREVRRLIARHDLPCYRLAGVGLKNVKIRLSEFRAWLEARRQR